MVLNCKLGEKKVFFLIVLVSTNRHLKETCDKSSLDCISLKSDLENSHAAEVGL